MGNLPTLTEEQRRAAVERAVRNRKLRAQVLRDLADGRLTIKEVVAKRDDPVVGRIRVKSILKGVPGIGRVKLERAMDELGIAGNRCVRGLGANQREALVAFYDEQTAKAEKHQRSRIEEESRE